MSVSFQARGVWTALVTPFYADGRLNREAFKQLIEFQIQQGVTGILPAGTTGESPTLDWNEHNQVIEDGVKCANARAGVLAGTGSNSTSEAIDATRHAADAGVSAALLVDCYYNGPSSLELRTEYYERIAAAVPEIPIVPYIIPGRCGTELGAADLALLHLNQPARFPAVKEATGNLERMKQDRELCGDKIAIMSGDDDMTLQMMREPRVGASGVISVMSNLVPGALSAMVRAQAAGDIATADKIAAELAPLFKMVTCKVPGTRVLPGGRSVQVEDKFRNPLAVKTMMAGLGMNVGPSRAPLGKMTKAGIDACRDALKSVHETAPHVLEPIAAAYGVKIAERLRDDAVWQKLTR